MTAIRKTCPQFEWTPSINLSEVLGSFGTFKVGAFDGTLEGKTFDPEQMKEFNLLWPAPSTFLKDNKKKESVWKDIQEKLIPILSQHTVKVASLSISNEELQKLLKSISDAKKPFSIVHPDGYTIGVNTTETVDVSLSSSDIANMLAAIWIFGAKGVRIA